MRAIAAAQELGLPRGDFDLDRLARRDPGLLALRLDDEPREIGRALAHLGENLVGGSAQLPVDETQLDPPDHVFLTVIAQADAAAGVHGFELRHSDQAQLYLAHELVALQHGEIAARANVHVRL